MIGVDIEIDNQNVLVVGFVSGLIEARKERTGDLIHSVSMNSTIANLFFKDFRM